MKLSEAIKEGKKKSGLPQLFGNGYFDWDNEGNVIACCALGYAYIAVKGVENVPEDDREITDTLYETFPILDEKWNKTEEAKWMYMDFFDVIAGDFNDSDKLDAEVIAEKVAERED